MTRRTRSKVSPRDGDERDSEEPHGTSSSMGQAAARAAAAAAATQKENVDNERTDFQPPSMSSTPAARRSVVTKDVASSALKTKRSASSLFSSPPPGRKSSASRPKSTTKNTPPASYGQWEVPPSSASRRGPQSRASGRERPQDSSSFAPPYNAQQTDPRSEERRMDQGGYGTLAADLDMAARGAQEEEDFGPTVADCLNLGSFAEESPPRHGQPSRSRQQQRGSPKSPRAQQPMYAPHQEFGGQPYPYRPSPPPQLQQQPPYPSSGGSGAQQVYYPPPSGSPYAYPPGMHPFRYGQQQPQYASMPPQNEQPWMSPPGQHFDYEGRPDSKYPAEQGNPMGSPALKKRRPNWDSSSSPSPEGDAGTPEKAFPQKSAEGAGMRSPFRSPITAHDRGSSKKFKRSPLFQGGTPGIAAYGSWDTPGGTLGATLSDEFSPMGPSFAPFGDDTPCLPLGGPEAKIPFDEKLSLAHSSSGEDQPRPVIRQRPAGQPAGSPFSSFVGELSPFPTRMQPSPIHHEQREYPSRYPGYHRAPEEFQRGQQGMAPHSASKQRPTAHLLASPVMSQHGSASKRPQPWYEHVAPSPGPFRLELGETQPGKTRKGFEDINSVLRGASGPAGHHQRPSPGQQGSYEGGRPRSSHPGGLHTPVKLEIGSIGPGSASRAPGYPGSARKQTPRFTPVSKSKSTTPGKTPSKGGKENTPKAARRSPCNCKKSKCLKLYCECFAAEMYCEGCNCGDCRNTNEFEPERAKAMKDTRAKNPNAFKPRIASRSGSAPTGSTPPSGHNMGCRCKRSECLKKYCECFQAGVMCANKCKCVDCLNYVGSQALIDKRRKIKDHRGADFAMRIADEAWKGKHAPRVMTPHGMPQPSPPGSHRGMPMPHMMQPSPSPHQRGPPAYMAQMMGHPHMGYSPMGIHPVTPGYMHGKPMPQSSGRRSDVSRSASYMKAQQQQTPTLTTPRTPGVRLGFDPHSSKKKRKLSPGEKEPAFPFFGNNPEQPKTTALAIFSYLSNDDVYNAGLVCKQWTRLSLDDELWQF